MLTAIPDETSTAAGFLAMLAKALTAFESKEAMPCLLILLLKLVKNLRPSTLSLLSQYGRPSTNAKKVSAIPNFTITFHRIFFKDVSTQRYPSGKLKKVSLSQHAHMHYATHSPVLRSQRHR